MHDRNVNRIRHALAIAAIAVSPWAAMSACESPEEEAREVQVETAEEVASAQAESEAALRGEHELAQEARGDLAEREIDELAELQEDMADVEEARAEQPDERY
ncbi:MAG TPA: hypothetical protein RMH99_02350 [Sandaracinaceae bacterium LLY-WYZ-13_1]|nr:hypothetical protein [Sandaracinaceae bacterium LLY-WYZ-13_1]